MNPGGRKKVAFYARYSSDNQRDASIEDQLGLCRLHAEKQSWTVVDSYSDRAISGALPLELAWRLNSSGLAFDKLTDERAAHGRLPVMCLPGSQDEIDWSAFGLDERVTLVVSPPRQHATSSSSPFCPGRMLANADTGVDHDDLAAESLGKSREHPPMN
ncbi:hypothetical protein ABID26_001134 [Mesorhizobium shonense]|uniref:Resolvase/invertase-type recombinase catalytic domain-containing protein n=1 Tax=Mesorhizobium shonense TaxID=1209948 RepID=A0ABV2HMF3_9HYPH